MRVDLIKELSRARGLTLKDLSKKINITETGLHNLIRNKSTRIDTLEKISEVLNVHPCVFFIDKLEASEILNNSSYLPNLQTGKVPIIENINLVGDIKGFLKKFEAKHYLQNEAFNDCDFCVKITNDTMHPKYNNGDLLVCKILKDPTRYSWGRAYVILTDQGPQINLITPNENENNITLECFNDRFKSMVIPKKSIKALALVRGSVSNEGS